MSLQIILISISLILFTLIDRLRCKKKKTDKILKECNIFIQKNTHKFTQAELEEIKITIADLEAQGNHKKAQSLYKKLENKRSFFHRAFLFIKGWAIPIILVFGIIKPMWFELMQIPTGSMRPTFKENDALAISKLQFGINIPMQAKHLFLDEKEIKRMGILTFTSENMPGNNTFKYFNIFPGYKQLTKRVVGLPGDTLYYYGGKIYGIDKDGLDISNDLQLSSLNHIEHIPFINIQGRFEKIDDKTFYLKQSGQNIASITYHPYKDLDKKLLDNRQKAHDIHNLWGLDGFAKFRLVTKEALHDVLKTSPDFMQGDDIYMECKHHPSIHKSTIHTNPYFYPIIHEETSYIPLKKNHIKALKETLYTARFHVKDSIATRYDFENTPQTHPITLEGVPDGTYEFFYGKGYRIGPQGVSKKLDDTHPLMRLSQENLYKLVNLGIEFDTRFDQEFSPFASPSRYAYFKDGGLYAMGGLIFAENDPLLKKFILYEKRLQEIKENYITFHDPGAPILKDGSLDIQRIKDFGLEVPNNHYFMLGDNHAMSGDSREFGFVPKENIRGAPSFIFWGPNERFGAPTGLCYKVFTKPRIFVWSLLFVATLTIICVRKKRQNSQR